MQVSANGISLEVDDRGPPDGAPLVMIMGLGMQLVAWPPRFVDALVQAGFRTLAPDNRDAGLSSAPAGARPVNLLWATLKQRLGLPLSAPYTLADMADDMALLLERLGIGRAHVVGVSMGGMIAQTLAARHAARVLSLTCIMSSSGARGLPGPDPQVLRMLLAGPRKRGDLEAVALHMEALIRLIGSPAYPYEPALLAERVRAALARAWRPEGTQRQMLAIAASGDRSAELARIRTPTLVLHGTADRLVPIACGRDIAARIAGARFVAIEGMGHDLPPGVVERLLAELLPHLRAAQDLSGG